MIEPWGDERVIYRDDEYVVTRNSDFQDFAYDLWARNPLIARWDARTSEMLMPMTQIAERILRTMEATGEPMDLRTKQPAEALAGESE